MDLFTMFLNSAFGWGVGKILDTLTSCKKCGQRDDQRIGNSQYNYIECSNCHRVINQFTNACDFTVNPQTKQIGHGLLDVGNYKWVWEAGDGLFDIKKEFLGIPFEIQIEGMKSRDVVLELCVRRYSDEGLVVSKQNLLNVTYEVTHWSNYVTYFHENKFSQADHGTLICDGRVMSEYKEIMFEHRRLIKPWK